MEGWKKDQLLMLFLRLSRPPKKRRESGKKQELSTPQRKEKLCEVWQASLFPNDSQMMVNLENGQC